MRETVKLKYFIAVFSTIKYFKNKTELYNMIIMNVIVDIVLCILIATIGAPRTPKILIILCLSILRQLIY